MAHAPQSILVTGGCGFIGSHVIDLLLAEYPGARVVNLDAMYPVANARNCAAAAASPRYTLVRGNVEDAELVRRVLVGHGIDTVLHFAAESHVDKSFGNSLAFSRANVLGTHALLEACRLQQSQLHRVIHVSTDEVYGEGEGETGSCPDRTLLRPTNPYAATKAAAEMLVHAYRASYGLPTLVTRGNNVYGPRQFPEKVIPKFALQLAAGRRLTIHGNGHVRRSFMHVSDAARAFVTVMARGEIGRVYNIGVADEVRVVDLAAQVAALVLGPGAALASVADFTEDRPFNDTRYRLDCGPLHALGWSPTVPFDQGLRETVAWYLDNAAYWPPNVVRTVIATPFPETPQSGDADGGGGGETLDGGDDHRSDRDRDRGGVGGDGAISSQQSAPAPAPATAADTHTSLPAPAPAPTDTLTQAPAPAPTAPTGPLRVLLWGASGWLGAQLAPLLSARGHTVIAARSRLEDAAATEAELLEARPDRVVNCAGVTGRPNVDWCEDHRLETMRVNVYGTVALTLACAARGVHVTVLGSGCIYEGGSGPRQAPFSESAPPNFSGSFYSRTKAAAEMLQRRERGVLLLRLRLPVGTDVNHPRNLVAKLSRYARIADAPNSVSVLHQLLPLACKAVESGVEGVFNWVNPGLVTNSDCLRAARRHCWPDLQWTTMPLGELSQHVAAPRSNCALDTTRVEGLAARLGCPLSPALEAVDEAMAIAGAPLQGGGEEGGVEGEHV